MMRISLTLNRKVGDPGPFSKLKFLFDQIIISTRGELQAFDEILFATSNLYVLCSRSGGHHSVEPCLSVYVPACRLPAPTSGTEVSRAASSIHQSHAYRDRPNQDSLRYVCLIRARLFSRLRWSPWISPNGDTG